MERWNGALEWSAGMEHWNGLLEWSTGASLVPASSLREEESGQPPIH